MYGMTRGERNNNPLNIRSSQTSWKGEVFPSKDSEFEQFETAAYGIRAGAKLVRNYYRLHGISTVKGIISRFAPSSENNTDAYILAVCKHMGVKPDDKLQLNDVVVLASLVTAIIEHENGRCEYDAGLIQEACQSVLGVINEQPRLVS